MSETVHTNPKRRRVVPRRGRWHASDVARAELIPDPSADAPHDVHAAASWTLSDFGLAWLSGLLGALVGSAFVNPQHRVTSLILVLFGQGIGVLCGLIWAGRRKHLMTFRLTDALRLRPKAIGWILVGIGLQVALLGPTALLAELYGSRTEQEVVSVAGRARGVQIPLIIVAVVIVAPIVEELLFRGVLLHALMRRWGSSVAVVSSALVFGLGHVLGDPSAGSLIALPAIVILGLVLGVQVVRTGKINRAIMMHVGFNAITAAALFS